MHYNFHDGVALVHIESEGVQTQNQTLEFPFNCIQKNLTMHYVQCPSLFLCYDSKTWNYAPPMERVVSTGD